jgi:hypothetical protein
VPGGSRRLQNDCEAHCVLGGFDSHALPPAPRLACNRVVILRVLRFHRLLATALVVTVGVLTPSALHAQRADSARVAPSTPAADTSTRAVPKPPLSPRRAFLYSLALPGYGQSRLGRTGAGALFVLTESIAIAMLRESKADLSEARQLRRDTLVVIGTDPTTGAPITQRNSYDDELITVRRGHVEDWVAFLFANHLFAAADAYVAAHLWDLPSQISLRQGPTGTIVAARLHW